MFMFMFLIMFLFVCIVIFLLLLVCFIFFMLLLLLYITICVCFYSVFQPNQAPAVRNYLIIGIIISIIIGIVISSSTRMFGSTALSCSFQRYSATFEKLHSSYSY